MEVQVVVVVVVVRGGVPVKSADSLPQICSGVRCQNVS